MCTANELPCEQAACRDVWLRRSRIFRFILLLIKAYFIECIRHTEEDKAYLYAGVMSSDRGNMRWRPAFRCLRIHICWLPEKPVHTLQINQKLEVTHANTRCLPQGYPREQPSAVRWTCHHNGHRLHWRWHHVQRSIQVLWYYSHAQRHGWSCSLNREWSVGRSERVTKGLRRASLEFLLSRTKKRTELSFFRSDLSVETVGYSNESTDLSDSLNFS